LSPVRTSYAGKNIMRVQQSQKSKRPKLPSKKVLNTFYRLEKQPGLGNKTRILSHKGN